MESDGTGAPFSSDDAPHDSPQSCLTSKDLIWINVALGIIAFGITVIMVLVWQYKKEGKFYTLAEIYALQARNYRDPGDEEDKDDGGADKSSTKLIKKHQTPQAS